MADLNVIYRIAADITGLQDGVKRAADATEGLESTVGRVGKAIVGAFSVHQVLEFGRQTTQAFAEEEAALRRLETALVSQGTFTVSLKQQYADLATQFQQTTAFSDDLVLEMQALLVQVGNVMPTQMEGALTAATNLSAGLGIDLRAATLLVGKAFAGETGTLKRYGIVIDDNKLKTEGASAVMEAINEKFGGQAQAAVKTYAGQVEQLNNKMSDAQEKIGGVVAQGLTPMLRLFNLLPDSLQVVVGGVSALTPSLEQLTLGLIAIGGPAKAGAAFMALWGAVAPLLATAGSAILAIGAGPLTLIVASIAAVVLAWKHWDTITTIVSNVYAAVKLWLVDKFQAVVESIKGKIDAVTGFFGSMYDKVVGHSFVPEMIAAIASEFSKLNNNMVRPTAEAASAVAGLFDQMSGIVIGKVAGMLDGLGGMLGEFAQKASVWMEGLISKLSTRWQGYVGAVSSSVGVMANGGSWQSGASAAVQAGIGAGMAASMAGATLGSSVAIGATTMGIGLAAVGVYQGIKSWMGQRESMAVNDLRDTWFAEHGGLHGINATAYEAGLNWSQIEPLDKAIFAADRKDEFAAAVENWERATGMAMGGLVRQPMLAMLGEAGPELVTPLDQLQGFGFNQPDIVVHTRIDVDGRMLARANARHTPSILAVQGIPTT